MGILDEFLGKLETLVNIESGSQNKQGLNDMADELASWYEPLGFVVQRYPLDERTGDLLEISNRPCTQYDVLLVGHTDTVFPDGTVAQRPFSRDDRYAYGPGVADMKGGCTAMYLIAKSLPLAVLETLNIGILYNPDEEIGSVYSRDRLDALAAQAEYVFVFESSGSNGFTRCFSRKGMLKSEITYHGRAGHAGFMFELDCASAIHALAEDVTYFSELASREKNTTVNIGKIWGGIASNVVADQAGLLMEMRYTLPEEYERVHGALHERLQTTSNSAGVLRELSSFSQTPPWVKTEESLAWIAQLQQLSEKQGIPFYEKDRGGLSDANHMAAVCKKLCCDGLGPQGELDHSDSERSELASVEPCVAFMCAVLDDIAQKKRRI